MTIFVITVVPPAVQVLVHMPEASIALTLPPDQAAKLANDIAVAVGEARALEKKGGGS